jgi:hypothetical protein
MSFLNISAKYLQEHPILIYSKSEHNVFSTQFDKLLNKLYIVQN